MLEPMRDLWQQAARKREGELASNSCAAALIDRHPQAPNSVDAAIASDDGRDVNRVCFFAELVFAISLPWVSR